MCGMPVGAAEVSTAPAEQATTPPPEVIAPQAKTGLCTKCGAQLKEGLQFCTMCGTPVEAAEVDTTQAEQATTPPPEVIAPQTKIVFCTKCGAQLKEGLQFCTMCGMPVGAVATAPAETPRIQRAESQNQYGAPPQSSSPAIKKRKSKAPVIIAVAAAAVVIVVVVIIAVNMNRLPPWEGYVYFEDFARAAEINDILPVGGPLTEKGFYGLMGSAFAGSLLEPFINTIFAGMGFHVTVTAKIDLVNGSELSETYNVPAELRQNYNYLVRRSGTRGTKTYLALRFDGKKVFGISIPYTGWIVLVYEEGAFIKF